MRAIFPSSDLFAMLGEPGMRRDFVFTNPVRLHGRTNPSSFDGTTIEGPARRLLGESAT